MINQTTGNQNYSHQTLLRVSQHKYFAYFFFACVLMRFIVTYSMYLPCKLRYDSLSNSPKLLASVPILIPVYFISFSGNN